MPRTHVAIVSRGVARQLAAGTKSVESRLSRHCRVPFGVVSAGDMLAFKVSGGVFIGRSAVLRVKQFAGLTPRGVAALRERYNELIAAPADYWRARRACRYAVLIWMGRFRACPADMHVPRQYGDGWVVLD